MTFKILIGLCLTAMIACVFATDGGWSDTYRKQDSHGNYKFGYKVVDKHGAKQSRSEEGDGWSKHGHYSLHDVDGRQRYVSYVADKSGFRAKIETNEPGTGNVDAAHAVYNGPDAHGHSETHVQSNSHGHESGGHGHGHNDHHGKGHDNHGSVEEIAKAYVDGEAEY